MGLFLPYCSLEALPNEMFCELLQWLSFPDWVSLRQVSKRCYALCNDQQYLSFLDLSTEDCVLHVPSMLIGHLADAYNLDALFMMGMYKFFTDTPEAVQYWVDYFAETNWVYEDQGIIILDAVFLHIELEDGTGHDLRTLTYLHRENCYHIRMFLYGMCPCCAYAVNNNVGNIAVGMLLDRLDVFYGLYSDLPRDSCYILQGNCDSERSPHTFEYSISSRMSGMLMSSERNKTPSFDIVVRYPPHVERARQPGYHDVYSAIRKWQDALQRTMEDSSSGSNDGWDSY